MSDIGRIRFIFVGALGLAVAALAANAWISYLNVERLNDHARWVIHSHEVLEASSGLLAALQDVEIGQRSYLVSGTDDYLALFSSGRDRAQALLAQLRRLTADDPAQRTRIETLAGHVDTRLEFAAETIAAQRSDGFEGARRLVLTDRGKRAMDPARADLADFRLTEERVRARLEDEVAQNRRAALATAVGAPLAGLALLAAAVFAMRRDSRERRAAETHVRESESRYRALVEHLPYAVLVTRAGAVVFANTTVAQLLGAGNPQVIVGRTLSDLIESGSLEVLGGRISAMEEQLSPAISRVEARWRRLDGTTVACETNAEPMQWGGRPATLLLLRDLTDRKLAEAAQRAVEARLGTIVDSVMDAIISIDEQQRVVLFNAAAERMFDVDASGAFGQPLERFIPQRFRVAHRKHVHGFQQTGVTKRRMGALGSLSGLRSNGQEFPIEASISQTMVEGQRVFTVVLRDITERMRTETELQLAQDRLAHMARLSTMGEMASGLSHEINQPLTAIATYAQALERIMRSDVPIDREEVYEAMHQISTQALRAGEVIRRLKAMIKNRDPEFRALDCHELISDVLALAEIDARLHQAEVRSTGAFRGVLVRGDVVQLQQVLINLIRNALDALGALSCERRVVTIALHVEREAVEFSVIDHGPGIPEELAVNMFGPFVTTKLHGTGLGLAISRSIVEAHRGRLSYRQTPGGGATFSFTLPLLASMETA